MINSFDERDFSELSSELGVSVRVLKQDYAALAALDLLSNSKLADQLIFKGGTAIKRMHFSNARFSVDLDFLYNEKIETEQIDIFFNENLSEIQEILRDTFLEQVSGSVFFKKMDEPIKSAKWVTITIDYDMPGFSFFTRIDIQFLSSLPARVERKRIITEPYGGNSGYLNTLYLEDVFLDKLVALYDRTSAKDLWDLYFLLHNGVKISTPLSSVIDIPIGKLLLAIDFISDTDWKLLYNYIPRQLAFPTLYQVKNEIRDFVIKNWI